MPATISKTAVATAPKTTAPAAPSASPLAGAKISITDRAARQAATTKALKRLLGEEGAFGDALAADVATILIDPLAMGDAPAWVALQTAWEAAGSDFLTPAARATLGGSIGGSLYNAVKGIRSRLPLDPEKARNVLRHNTPMLVKLDAAKRLVAALNAEWLPGGDILDAAIGILHAAEEAPVPAPALTAGN